MSRSYMTVNFLLIVFVFFCTLLLKSNCSSSKLLHNALDESREFFDSLKTLDDLNEIDAKINKFTQSHFKTIQSRKKREINDYNKGVDVLNELETIFQYDINDKKNLIFFSLSFFNDTGLFAAAFNSSHVTVYHIHENEFNYQASYPVINGKQLIVDKFNENILITVVNPEGILVLRLNYYKHVISLNFAHELNNSEITHINTWIGMKQLYLGIATNSKLLIYKWLEENFDKIQTLDFGSTKIMPFESKGFMHIAAAGPKTKILKYKLNSDKFEIIQKLPKSNDIFTFSVEENYLSENFLITSSSTSTIIYKQIHNRFIPFQEIDASKKAVAFPLKKTILIFLLNENNVNVYQYSGWIFLKLKNISKINDIEKISIHGKYYLRTKYNNFMQIQEFIWTEKIPWETQKRRLQSWCNNVKNNLVPLDNILPNLNSPLKLTNAHIKELQTHKINGIDLKKLENLTDTYNNTNARLQNALNSLKYKNLKNTIFCEKLFVKNATIKCQGDCKVNKLITKKKSDLLQNLRRIDNKEQSLKLENLKVKELPNKLKCPIPALFFQDISFNGIINDIRIKELKENALKVFGNQEITGDHIYSKVSVTNAKIPLKIATETINEEVTIPKIIVKNLNLPNITLLPLNSSSVTMTKSIYAPKVIFNNNIDFRGAFTGKAMNDLNPSKFIDEPLILTNNYTLRNVKIEDILEVEDFIRNNGSSLNEILDNSISLNESIIPVHLILTSDKVKWENVTLENHPQWITKYSNDTVIISGKKVLSDNVNLTEFTEQQLPSQRLNVKLCAFNAFFPDVKTSTLVLDELNAKKLKATHIYGAKSLNDTISNLATSFKDIDMSKKSFTGEVKVINATIRNMQKFKVEGIEEFLNKWNPPNTILGTIELENLTVETLYTDEGLKRPFPDFVKNLVISENAFIDRINDIDMQNFLKNTVKIDQSFSATNITFDDGFSSDLIRASQTSMNLNPLNNFNLKSKKIKNILKTDALHLPYNFEYPPLNNSIELIIHGSLTCNSEPKIDKINGDDLQSLFNTTWMVNEDAILTGKNISMKNVTLKEKADIKGNVSSPFSSESPSIINRILSKEKPQIIDFPATFTNIQVSNILSTKNANIKSFVPEINKMLTNALTKNSSQDINSTLRMEKVSIIGDLNLKGKLNNLNLSTDIVRHDSKQNLITGRKIVNNLKTKELKGLKFDELVNNAALKNRNLITIKGKKIFKNIDMNELSLNGTIMGKNVKNILLKSSNQTISGFKTIKADVKTNQIISEYLINDINIIELIKNQLKKNKSMQRIKSPFKLLGNLDVFGNVTFKSLYNRIELKSLNAIYENTYPIESKWKEMQQIADKILVALKDRAIYINKLELTVDDKNVTFKNMNKENKLTFKDYGQCEIVNTSLNCNSQELIRFDISMHSKNFLKLKLVDLRGRPVIIFAKSESIAVYNVKDAIFKEIYIPDIQQVAIEVASNILWITLQLPHETIVLRYDLEIGYQKYILPEAKSMLINSSPNKQLLLITSQGLWNLDGLGNPQQIFKGNLIGKLETSTIDETYFVKSTNGNETNIFKAIYVGTK